MSKKTGKSAEDKQIHSQKKGSHEHVDGSSNGHAEGSASSDNATENQSDDLTAEFNTKISELETKIEKLSTQLGSVQESEKSWNDKYLRLSAEFDNYRKRTLKEKADLTKQANADLLKDILSVVDDFERGMAHLNEADDISSLKTGIELIYSKFVEFLRQNSVREIEAKEKDFDIDFHEALTKIPAPTEEMKGKVVDVIEKGYMLNDKVIRYAKVVVGE